MIRWALVGNPNSGKSTLFNALTGAQQDVGNWPGVTVEKKLAFYRHLSGVEIIDLPGCYSLVQTDAEPGHLDEQVASDFLLQQPVDLLINVVDATQLERQLYLSLQLIEQQLPVVIVLSMMDMSREHGVELDCVALARHLGVPVIPINAYQAESMKALLRCLNESIHTPRPPAPALWPNYWPEVIQRAVQALPQHVPSWQRLRAIEGELRLPIASCLEVTASINALQDEVGPLDECLAKARFDWISGHLLDVVRTGGTTHRRWRKKLDRVLLNRALGIPLFFLIMYAMFAFAIQGGGYLQACLELYLDKLFIEGPQALTLGAPGWLTAALLGAGQGLHTTLSFAPIIGCMFIFLSILEMSGYMSRVAFLMDKFMHTLGLPGKSFVPLIVGFGCNVPAIMGARTLANMQERILTIMMAPFISCGARLTIYAVFASAFFKQGGQAIIFGLYLFGISLALLTGLLLRKTLLKGPAAPFILELPSYRLPSLQRLLMQSGRRLSRFLTKAGMLIVPLCMVVTLLSQSPDHGPKKASPYLVQLGQMMTPAFKPMGIEQDNWPATVGLLSGLLAKEVVIGTLQALYAQELEPTQSVQLATTELTEPWVLSIMTQRFKNLSSVVAYLIFVLLYFPCVSVVATIAKELNLRWALFSLSWSTGLAYTMAVSFYQLANFSAHPRASTLWLTGSCVLWSSFWLATARWGHQWVGLKHYKPLPTPIRLS